MCTRTVYKSDKKKNHEDRLHESLENRVGQSTKTGISDTDREMQSRHASVRQDVRYTLNKFSKVS